MKNLYNYSEYECPYSHLEKDCGHKLRGPENYENTHGVWCECGFRGPVFYLDPLELKLNKIISNETNQINSSHKSEFEKARKVYPGSKRGLDTEWKNFIKKHKDYKEVSMVLSDYITKQSAHKAKLAQAGSFVAEWPHFQTWINQRRWEEELPEIKQPSNNNHVGSDPDIQARKDKIQKYRNLIMDMNFQPEKYEAKQIESVKKYLIENNELPKGISV